MKPISKMTPDELRVEIAERKGAIRLSKTSTQWFYRSNGDPIDNSCPDWTTDPAACLALLDEARKADGGVYSVVVSMGDRIGVTIWKGVLNNVVSSFWGDDFCLCAMRSYLAWSRQREAANG